MITNHQVHFETGRRSPKKLVNGAAPKPVAGRIPRVSKFAALAIRFDGLIHDGKVKNQAELARLTQIMNLLHLAPDIQEALLNLSEVESGRDTILLRDMQPIAMEEDWGRQRELWQQPNVVA
jgi:hypothetical protein